MGIEAVLAGDQEKARPRFRDAVQGTVADKGACEVRSQEIRRPPPVVGCRVAQGGDGKEVGMRADQDLKEWLVDEVEADERHQVAQGALENGDSSAGLDGLPTDARPVSCDDLREGSQLLMAVQLRAVGTQENGLVDDLSASNLAVTAADQGQERMAVCFVGVLQRKLDL